VALYSEAQASRKLVSGLERDILWSCGPNDEKLDHRTSVVVFRLAQDSSPETRPRLRPWNDMDTRTKRWSIWSIPEEEAELVRSSEEREQIHARNRRSWEGLLESPTRPLRRGRRRWANAAA